MENILTILYQKQQEVVQYVERKISKSYRFFPYYSYNYIQTMCKDPHHQKKKFWSIVYDKVYQRKIGFTHFEELLKRYNDFEPYELEELHDTIATKYITKKEFIELCMKL